MEFDAAGETVGGDVVLEDGADFREIEADAGDLRVGEGDLGDEIALCGADVDGGFVVGPGEFFGDGHVGSVADAGHGAEEVAEALGIGVEGFEGVFAAGADLVLRFAGAEGGGEVAPEGVETVVGHLEYAADVRGFALVEEEIGGRGVVVGAVAALEEAEGDEGVEEVVCGARVKAEACAEFGRVSGCLASSVKSSSSTALSRTFEAQKPRPTCRIWSGVASFMTVRSSGNLLREPEKSIVDGELSDHTLGLGLSGSNGKDGCPRSHYCLDFLLSSRGVGWLTGFFEDEALLEEIDEGALFFAEGVGCLAISLSSLRSADSMDGAA